MVEATRHLIQFCVLKILENDKNNNNNNNRDDDNNDDGDDKSANMENRKHLIY